MAEASKQAKSTEIPSELTIVQHEKKQFVLWKELHHKLFVTWWLTTEAAQLVNDKKCGDPNWKAKQHHSDFWSKFDQMAEHSKSTSEMICKHCQTFLSYPSFS
ncbi:uncharacterized protein CIMG_13238 [Coccidioides immitis RS]|uniref:Uncharacterized protein n=1 Tax=Coccidioides immitis (strain RS) TaxID=246410 RepID=J3K591_COCIM|nr:uncharacterized protein CIMG_13238 [Coccidioides immitis RS]EAS29572.3 hypothetical protein CIMG_13238 [Coccidioides immitis RS]